MGLRHWLDDTVEDLREDPSLSTAEISLRKFWAGVLGRTRDTPAAETVVWNDDWDVLVILDGCRLDLLRETARTKPFEWFPAAEDIEAVWSVGSTSKEWLKNTFAEDYSRQIELTACVTGEPVYVCRRRCAVCRTPPGQFGRNRTRHYDGPASAGD
jgi:hypothetical protein